MILGRDIQKDFKEERDFLKRNVRVNILTRLDGSLVYVLKKCLEDNLQVELLFSSIFILSGGIKNDLRG